MSKLSFADLAKKASESSVTTTAVVKPLDADSYLAKDPRIALRYGVTKPNEEKPEKGNRAYGTISFSLKFDDPKMTEAEVPVRTLSVDLHNSFMEGANGITFESMSDGEGGIFYTGLDQKQNAKLWQVLGNIFSVAGMADSLKGGTEFSYPAEGEIQKAMRLDETYIKNGEAILNNEYPVNTKGEPVENTDLFPFVMAQNQIEAVNKVLKSVSESMEFKADLVIKHDDFRNEDVNQISRIFLKVGDDWLQIL